jgi:hypothetical protein
VVADGTPGAVWEELRATRWNPPGAALGPEDRRRTYVFALEQAEQMFEAAVGVGPATRPLLVYYGLNQAGRAIAAAASEIESGDGWQMRGHGLHCQPGSLYGPLSDIRIWSNSPSSKGSFVKLSALLDSPVWGKESHITLTDFWDSLPENRLSPLHDRGESRRTPLYVEHRDLFSDPHPIVHVPVVFFPPWVINAPDSSKSLADYIASFPEARGFHSVVHYQGALAFQSHADGWGEINMNWMLPHEQPGSKLERLAYLERISRLYNGALYFFPELDASGRSAHPLMVWWAVLYTLSMLARYHPAEWAEHIDVDRSRHAVPLENLLKSAIDVVPRLIVEAIDQVTRADS